MRLADETPWRAPTGFVDGLRHAYEAMTPGEPPAEMKRILKRIESPPRRRHVHLAIVAQADPERQTLAQALLEEADLDVVACASAEAALAVLVKESDDTVFLLADNELSGARDAEALGSTVRMLWPGIHVAIASAEEDARRALDASGIVRISHPWRGLDVLIEAERALVRAG